MNDIQGLKENISKVLPHLLLAGEAEKERYFESLCLYTSRENVNFIFSFLTKRKDIESIRLLIRYLIQIEKSAGIEKLFLLLKHDDEIIREEACSGLELIPVDARLDILMNVLELPHSDVVCYAAKNLGKIGRSVVTGSLLRKLRETDDEEIQLEILKVLGKLKDPRSIGTLEDLIQESSPKVQKEAFVTIGKFASSVRPNFLKKCLNSQYVERREIAYLIILRSQRKDWEKLLSRYFANEKEDKVRVRILSSIRNILSKEFFDLILQWAIQPKSSEIKILSISVLKRIKSDKMYFWIMHNIHAGKDEVKELALRLLAEYCSIAAVRREIERIYLNSKSNKIKLIALDLLGKYEDPQSQKFLFKIIEEKNSFSYPAAISLCEILSSKDIALLERIFPAEVNTPSGMTQLVLNYILRLPLSLEIPLSLWRKIESLMGSSHNIQRYLAIRCLVRNSEIENLRKLLLIYTEDRSVIIKSLCQREIVRIVSEKPQSLSIVLNLAFYTRNFFPVLAKLFADVSVGSEENFLQVIRALLNLIDSNQKDKQSRQLLNTARVILLLRNQILKDKSVFIKIFQQNIWSDAQRWALMKAVNKTNLNQIQGSQVRFMAQQFERSSEKTKIEYLKFFQNMRNRNEDIEEAVFHALSLEKENPVREKLSAVIASWIMNSAAAQPGA